MDSFGNTHCDILPVLSDYLPTIEDQCKSIIKFTRVCGVSECAAIRRLAMFALFVSRLNSILSRNAIFLSIRYGLDTFEVEQGILISVACVLSREGLFNP